VVVVFCIRSPAELNIEEMGLDRNVSRSPVILGDARANHDLLLLFGCGWGSEFPLSKLLLRTIVGCLRGERPYNHANMLTQLAKVIEWIDRPSQSHLSD
jgi:hypothetical protein